MPNRSRSRFLRRVRSMARVILPYARSRLRERPRPRVERIVGHVVQLFVWNEMRSDIFEISRNVLESLGPYSLGPNPVQDSEEDMEREPVPPVPEEDDNICCVCYDRENQVRLPRCGHLLCGTCPAHLQVYDPRCPQCRMPFDTFDPLPGVGREVLIPLDIPLNLVTDNTYPQNSDHEEPLWDTSDPRPNFTLYAIQGSVDTRPRITWGRPDNRNMVECNLCGTRVNNNIYRMPRHSTRCPGRL